jgi:hypothetical protein
MYELWDEKTLNMIDCYGSASQAATAISATVATGGLSVLSSLVLVREDEDGDSETVAEGEAILVVVKRLNAEETSPSPARHVV